VELAVGGGIHDLAAAHTSPELRLTCCGFRRKYAFPQPYLNVWLANPWGPLNRLAMLLSNGYGDVRPGLPRRPGAEVSLPVQPGQRRQGLSGRPLTANAAIRRVCARTAAGEGTGYRGPAYRTVVDPRRAFPRPPAPAFAPAAIASVAVTRPAARLSRPAKPPVRAPSRRSSSMARR